MTPAPSHSPAPADIADWLPLLGSIVQALCAGPEPRAGAPGETPRRGARPAEAAEGARD